MDGVIIEKGDPFLRQQTKGGASYLMQTRAGLGLGQGSGRPTGSYFKEAGVGRGRGGGGMLQGRKTIA